MWQEITPNTRKKHVQMKSGTMNVVNDYAGFSMAKLWSYQHGYHFSANSIIHDPRVAPSPSSATKFGCSNFKQFIYYQFMTRTRRVGAQS